MLGHEHANDADWLLGNTKTMHGPKKAFLHLMKASLPAHMYQNLSYENIVRKSALFVTSMMSCIVIRA